MKLLPIFIIFGALVAGGVTLVSMTRGEVLAPFQSSQDKLEISVKTSKLNSLRVDAAFYQDMNQGSYEGICEKALASGTVTECNDNKDVWAATVQLTFFKKLCADSTPDKAKEIYSSLGDRVMCPSN